MADRIPFRLADLHPIMRDPIDRMIDLLQERFDKGLILTDFRPFEGYRTPERQRELFATTKNTKADAWQSAHQYGLAVDFAAMLPTLNRTWDWGDGHEWTQLKFVALQCGLDVPIQWDRGHVEHPDFRLLRTALKR